MNPYMEFTHKTDLAYSAMCRPLCRELKLTQTAFDILLFLANNPGHDTASAGSRRTSYQSTSTGWSRRAICAARASPATAARPV